MTPDQQEFVKIIEKCPTDENARAVYADWLDERGFSHEAAWQRSGGRMASKEFLASVVAQDDDDDYEEIGYVVCVVERQGLRIALLAKYGHNSVHDTWSDLCQDFDGDYLNDKPDDVVCHPRWIWIGSVEEFLGLARNDADPTIPTRKNADEDYQVDHLRAVYRQVQERAERGEL